MIPRETLEAEIVELTSELDRRVSAVRGLFAEVAGLRTEIELLRRILTVRDQGLTQTETVSVIVLGVACAEHDGPSALCAVTWSQSKEQPSDVQVLLKVDWQSALPDWIQRYITDLSRDWKQLVQTRPARLLALISELSVGPLRTIRETEMSKGKVSQFIMETLGEAAPLTSLSIIR